MTMTMTKAINMNDATKPTRDQLRAVLIGKKHEPQRKRVELFGVEVELQQPTLRSILEAQDASDELTRTADVFIQYAYVPDTDERVFEEGDRDVILNWPFTEDLVKVQLLIAELTGVDIRDAEEELKDPLSESS